MAQAIGLLRLSSLSFHRAGLPSNSTGLDVPVNRSPSLRREPQRIRLDVVCASGIRAHSAPQSAQAPGVWTVARTSLAAAALSLCMTFGLPAVASGSPLVLDAARVLTPDRARELETSLRDLEAQSGWRVRVATRTEPTETTSGAALRALFATDERTVLVVEDLTAPNVLKFSAGAAVPLSRGFFLELQSRFGNQFFVAQEGEARALLSATGVLNDCLTRPGGCRSVPGLTDDLYFLTLSTSIAAGCVVGFASRIPPSGRISASWQWVLLFSPLWLLLGGAFGVLPIVGRTSDLEPLLKNLAGFCAGAVALYLTPILGPPPTSNNNE